MKDEENDQTSQEEEKKNQWSTEDGLKFLKELREMPYDTSKMGQVFVTFHGRKLAVKKNSEKEQEKPEEK